MSAKSSTRFVSLALTSCFALSGCTFLPNLTTDSSNEPSPAEPAETAIQPEQSTSDVTTASSEQVASAAPQRNFFNEGVSRAQSAVAIGQSAQSADDWKLAESRWNQAVLLMQQVPASAPNHAAAQQKVEEYQQNAAQASQKAAGESPAVSVPVADSAPNGLVARIPITRRLGGIPVVPVMLTGNESSQQVSMLFDTGASGTLITAAMAQSVGVVIVGEATVTVADGRQVQMPVGYVDTLEVGGLVVQDILVGIGGDVGLLGQDVYGQYGISAGGSSINLYD